MRFRLVPRDPGFYPLFNEAAENALSCARALADELGSLPASEKAMLVVVDAERKADELRRKILERLDTSIVTPFDREDIHALADRMDDITDDMRAAAEYAVLHGVTRPLPGLDRLVEILVQATEAHVRLVGKLKTLKTVQRDLDEIDALETEADAIHRRTVAHLYSGAYDALDVLKWSDVVEEIERAINAVEKSGDLVAAIAIKHA